MAGPGQPLYFFLSYARGGDDATVRKFFDDLCEEVRVRAGVRPGVPVGFLDRDVTVGTGWGAELMAVLSTCRTFVALLSPRYVHSVHCGREWRVFADRLRTVRHVGAGPDALIPVLWLGAADLPDRVRALHFLDGEADPAYLKRGLRQIARMPAHQDAYTDLVARVGRRIATAAPLAPGPNDIAYEQVRSYFH
jgi:hypothetical protein